MIKIKDIKLDDDLFISYCYTAKRAIKEVLKTEKNLPYVSEADLDNAYKFFEYIQDLIITRGKAYNVRD